MSDSPKVENVNLTIDGKKISVPKGTNLIEAAKKANTEIPHYCYHPDLSVPGNCRMCQVEVVGAPKLMIGCHTQAQEGMEVKTHLSSKEVEDAQAATLEFILINHPLDCTVCDQAGHCKLQDYHYEYNARPSRFMEEKVKKVKAESLGPTVMLDGERCIMCTRCIRFCDEVTETSELGMLNRGDRSVISINPGKVLDNALSGTVVDLCPVGALTHKNWRFNTRIWYTKQTDAICPGCSTGCNVKVAIRDEEVVQVKARYNENVNKEWLCDEGRYGFERFLPKSRVLDVTREGNSIDSKEAIKDIAAVASSEEVVVFLSPDLLTEEYYALSQVKEKYFKSATFVVAHKTRELTKVESILVSPDYSANIEGARFVGLVGADAEKEYEEALVNLQNAKYSAAFFVGDRSIDSRSSSPAVWKAISELSKSVGILTDADSELFSSIKTVLPGRSVLEKSGILINKDKRVQYTQSVIEAKNETKPEWQWINAFASSKGSSIYDSEQDRQMTLSFLSTNDSLKEISIKKLKNEGFSLER